MICPRSHSKPVVTLKLIQATWLHQSGLLTIFNHDMTLSIEANCFSSIPSGVKNTRIPLKIRDRDVYPINMPNMELDKLILKL